MIQLSKTLRNLGILSSVIIFSLTISLITFAAWAEPIANPPGGNVDVPVNVGATLQNKTGSLGLGGLTVGSYTYLATTSGRVGIGTTNPGSTLTVESTGGGSARIYTHSTSTRDIAYFSNHGSVRDAIAIFGPNDSSNTTGEIAFYAAGSKQLTISETRSTFEGDVRLRGGDLLFSKDENINIKGNTTTTRFNIYSNTDGSNSRAWIEMWGEHESRAGELALAGTQVVIRTNSTTSGTGSPRMTITKDGDVGINTQAPGKRLHVNGDVQATTYYYSSDIRLKENIQPLKNSLDGILKLNGISYTLKESGEKSLGFSAQQVKEIFPDAVSEDNEGMLSINSSALIAPLVEAVKEQNVRINILEKELELMKK